MSNSGTTLTVGILSRGDPESPVPTRENSRLHRIFEELAALGVTTEAVIFSEEALADIRRRLLSLDGVLVWVDPIVAGRNRVVLDALLRDVAEQGVFVSAHPDVILKMGTKDVLVYTRDMEWGTNAYLYNSIEELSECLPPLLRAGPRVLKQLRGNGGNGVWKIRLLTDVSPSSDSKVEVLHALRGSKLEQLTLGDFIQRCAPYFEGTGCVIDQPYQTRLGEGMIRCYMVHDRVVGFGHQFVTALLEPPTGTIESPIPPPRVLLWSEQAGVPGSEEPAGIELDSRNAAPARRGHVFAAGDLGRRLSPRSQDCSRYGHVCAVRDQRQFGVSDT